MISLLLILISAFTFAAPQKDWACFTQMQKLLKEWKATEEWQKHFKEGLRSPFYASPTHEIGSWVLVSQIPEGIVLAKADQEGRTEAILKSPECKAKAQLYPEPHRSQGYFRDQELKKYVETQKKGIIYLWSPRMGLSQKGLKQIELAAQKEKLPVLILMEKSISDAEVKTLSKEFGESYVRRGDSFEFKMRNAGLHYPVVMVFKDGKILPGTKYGYEDATGYGRDISRMLNK